MPRARLARSEDWQPAVELPPKEKALRRIRQIAQKGTTGETELDLSRLALRSLPPELWQLNKLTNLDLSGNEISRLPSAIGILTNLTFLNLSQNLLTSLPENIWQLAKLTRLDLSKNKLTILSSEIRKLTNLASLNISDNQLTSLPPEIGLLIKLEEFVIQESLTPQSTFRPAPKATQQTSFTRQEPTYQNLYGTKSSESSSDRDYDA